MVVAFALLSVDRMKHAAALLGFMLTAAVAIAACSSSDEDALAKAGAPSAAAPGSDAKTAADEGVPNVFEGLPTGKPQIDALCARGDFNAVTNAVCIEKAKITSISELYDALGLGFRATDRNGTNGGGGNPAFALLGHSSSLVARDVSAINPRAFVFSAPPGQPARIPGYVVVGFARGESFAEIAAHDPKSGKLSFYLFRFDLACDETHSCKPADLLTPAVERNWRGYTVYDDEDLKNTLVDCRHCHQPDGPSSKPMLRMQELEDPWTHWFRSDRPGGVALLQDYFRAHGSDEDYAGIPAALIAKSDGRALEDLVIGQGFENQPNAFDSRVIEQEVAASSRTQPLVNIPAGNSSTWRRLFDAAALGQAIPPPYHDVKVTDPDKLQFATDQYKAFKAGQIQELPDIRQVFLDSALEAMTMRPKAGLTGREVLVQQCGQCHNPKLDPSISRAGFDATRLDAMTAAQKENAVRRLQLPASDRLHMPPSTMRSLTPEALAAALEALK